MIIKDQIVFTSSTSTDKKVENGKHALFFDVHSNPEAYKKAFETMEVDYRINNNEWGYTRVVLVPSLDSHGRPYLFGASMKVREVDNLVRNTIIEAILIGFLVCLIGSVLSFLLAGSISVPIEKLTKIAEDITKGNLNQRIEIKGGLEMESLSKSFNFMTKAIRDTISELNTKNVNLKTEIGERRQAEDALRQSHERFLTVLDGIDATVYVADMETYEILFMNKHMIESFGQDLTGEKCWLAFRNEKGPCQFCTNRQLIDDKGQPSEIVVWQDQNPITNKFYTNHDRAIEWTDGHIVRLQIATDITELKNIEGHLLKAQKMEAIGNLAGGIAHDFNNMLSVILGNAEIAIEDIEPSNPLINNIQAIQNAAHRSSKLTRQLLAFARRQTITPKVLNLNNTIATMLKMLRQLIGENIDLSWDAEKALWPVKIDPSQIDQMLTNLCVNARDSIKDVGKIMIETNNVTLDESYCNDHSGFIPGDYSVIVVSDDGCGMNKKTLNNIFEPFFTTKELGKGTGLGLSTVYGIVKQNNGFINVYSEKDQGTTIKIYLPRLNDELKIEEQKSPEEINQRGYETILLVEDEKAILQTTKMMLERLGYKVLAADTPDKAIRISDTPETDIHLLITDVIMPSMNGRDLAEKIYQIFPKMKCLFMSGYTANVIAHKGILDEGLHFINKPFSKQDLSIKLRELLDKNNI